MKFSVASMGENLAHAPYSLYKLVIVSCNSIDRRYRSFLLVGGNG